ncbi:hypothetical protein T492DRAFT_1077289, partial [Pavlovales sp. CCMP2436]
MDPPPPPSAPEGALASLHLGRQQPPQKPQLPVAPASPPRSTWDNAEREPAKPAARQVEPLESLTHVLELTGLSPSLPQPQLFSLISSVAGLEADDFTLVPVSGRVWLLALRSTAAASAALHAHASHSGAAGMHLKPLSAASEEAGRFAAANPLPAAQRQRTTAVGASRLIAGALGVRAPAGASRGGGLVEERRTREEESARKQQQQAEADAMWN